MNQGRFTSTVWWPKTVTSGALQGHWFRSVMLSFVSIIKSKMAVIWGLVLFWLLLHIQAVTAPPPFLWSLSGQCLTWSLHSVILPALFVCYRFWVWEPLYAMFIYWCGVCMFIFVVFFNLQLFLSLQAFNSGHTHVKIQRKGSLSL